MATLVQSASATTTSEWFELKSHPRGAVIATITANGTFGSSQMVVQTSPDAGTNTVEVNLDPQGVNSAFVTSGRFTSAGAVNIEVGHGQYVRAIAMVSGSASANPISAFITY